MKYFFLFTLIFVLTHFQQNVELNGAYKVEYGNSSKNEGYISFYKNNFKWRPQSFLPFEGKINYLKNIIYLESGSNLIYSIRNENIKNDTIVFYIHDKNTNTNYLDIAIGQGKFIKEN